MRSQARLGALLAACVVSGSLTAGNASAEQPDAGVSFKEACRMYAESYGSLEEVVERYSQVEANDSAVELERLVGLLGFSVAPRRSGRDPFVDSEAKKLYHEARFGLASLSTDAVTRKSSGIGDLQGVEQAYLVRYAPRIDLVIEHLLDEPAPAWESRPEKLALAPLPNLLGLLDLHRLLAADALLSLKQGDSPRALRAIEGGWQLAEAAQRDGTRISNLIYSAAMRLYLGVLRQLPPTAGLEWIARLEDLQVRPALFDSLRREGWMFLWLDFEDAVTNPAKREEERLHWPALQAQLATWAARHLERVDSLAERPSLCPDTGNSQLEIEELAVPPGHEIGALAVELSDYRSLAETLGRLARLEYEIELTWRWLELANKTGKTLVKPGEILNSTAMSTTCPDEEFQIITTAETLTISFSHAGELWSELGGPKTPDSFDGRVARNRGQVDAPQRE